MLTELYNKLLAIKKNRVAKLLGQHLYNVCTCTSKIRQFFFYVQLYVPSMDGLIKVQNYQCMCLSTNFRIHKQPGIQNKRLLQAMEGRIMVMKNVYKDFDLPIRNIPKKLQEYSTFCSN